MILPELPKNLLSKNTTSRYKIDSVTPQKAVKMQYPLLMTEFTRGVNGATPRVTSSLSCLIVVIDLINQKPNARWGKVDIT